MSEKNPKYICKKINVFLEEKSFFSIVASLILVYLLFLLVVRTGNGGFTMYRSFIIPNCVLLIFFGIFYLLLWKFSFVLQKKTLIVKIAYSKCFFAIVIALIFVFQLVIAYTCYFQTAWDVKLVLDNAQIYVATGQLASIDYFSQNTNNLLLLRIYILIYKYISAEHGLYVILTIIALLNSISGVMVFDIIKKLSGIRNAWLGFFSWFVLIGTSPWLLVPYSDSLTLHFPIFYLWIWLKASEVSKKKKIVLYSIFSICAILSYSIKPQTVIVVIAIIIIEFVKGITNKTMLITCRNIACFSFFAFVILMLVSTWKRSDFPLEEEREFSATHYLMMGLNEISNGVYNAEDAEYSASFNTVKERTANNIQTAKDRIASMGITGLLKHEQKKVMTTFHDGTFGWEQAGNFYYTIYPEPVPVISNILRKILIGGGDTQMLAQTIRQGVWILVLLLAFGGTLVRGKELDVLYLTMIGVFAFVLLFEVSARYIYINIPIFIVAAFSGNGMFIFKKKY